MAADGRPTPRRRKRPDIRRRCEMAHQAWILAAGALGFCAGCVAGHRERASLGGSPLVVPLRRATASSHGFEEVMAMRRRLVSRGESVGSVAGPQESTVHSSTAAEERRREGGGGSRQLLGSKGENDLGYAVSESTRSAKRKDPERTTTTHHTRTHRGARASNNDGFSSILLKNFYNNQYVGTLGIGTPNPQYMTVVFDSGSADVVVPGRGCSKCGDHQTFDYTKSLSYAPKLDTGGLHTMFRVEYGSGTVQGYEGTETLTLGNGVVVTDVPFGEVLFESEEIRSFMMDGIVGLGFPGLSMVTRPTLLELFHEQNPDTPYQFSVYLSSDPRDTSKPSMLLLGGYDLSLVSPNATWHYTPVVRYGYGDTYWSVEVTSVSVSGRGNLNNVVGRLCDDRSSADGTSFTGFSSSLSSSCRAIVDTGTSDLGVPTRYYEELVSLITRGINCHGTTCYGAKVSDFPDLTIGLNPDNLFPLRAEDYVVCSNWGQCLLRIQEQKESDFFILGDVFIESYYTLFDVEHMRVGFACSGQCMGGSWHGTGGFMQLEPVGGGMLKAVFLMAVVLGMASAMYLAYSLWPHRCTKYRPLRSTREAEYLMGHYHHGV